VKNEPTHGQASQNSATDQCTMKTNAMSSTVNECTKELNPSVETPAQGELPQQLHWQSMSKKRKSAHNDLDERGRKTTTTSWREQPFKEEVNNNDPLKLERALVATATLSSVATATSSWPRERLEP
jgi:hypothetical protein